MTLRLVEDPIPLRSTPPLNDIPGRLLQLAIDIESGEVEAESVLVVIPSSGDFPAIFGFGEHLGEYGNIAVLELAKTWFVNNQTAR